MVSIDHDLDPIYLDKATPEQAMDRADIVTTKLDRVRAESHPLQNVTLSGCHRRSVGAQP